ncbi:aminoglycoside 6'-N-acetyltransferase [Oceanobacillus sp. J11TS1]|uniref:aminoglycoside 6'-N-acetyltransferase n=1 Tax=Oceanobacillus sp. J11TS1 TaxID=2807191 RepID=UPI001B0E047F|nr:aminoglycoside 6'-N-acetyltransferase [Oceanobacillus sp. J11TS1]GIO23538.1 N-acetyltransferase [Oceanobacillus sp. J11TS1]
MLKEANSQDIDSIVSLAKMLWPENELLELKEEFEAYLKDKHACILLAVDDERAVGFAQGQLRFDYVEGTETSPVGYLEGIYVQESHRKKGYARQLVRACEQWAKEMGCSEFASDCTIDNNESLAMHLRLGFKEAGRIICFKKSL